jgi:hypothetical protein
MTDRTSTPANAMVALMVGELHIALISSSLFEGINLHVTQQDDRALIHIMAVSTSSLGVLLATLTDPAELDDPDSLSRRITPGDRRTGPDQWQYELAASRYPGDHAIALSAKILLPIADLPEVVGRLRRCR